MNQSLKGKTAELRGELEGEQERVRPVREEADALRNKVRLSMLFRPFLVLGIVRRYFLVWSVDGVFRVHSAVSVRHSNGFGRGT